MITYPNVLLVDGMSLLVRADRAARKMEPLSYHGTDTRTLVAFTGSLVRALRMNTWTHVVVGWEGQPDLNWRKQFWSAYKSNRPRHHDGAPVMSRAEELAQEFMEAAGIYQTWESTMEGDDIVACAWRQFRHLGRECRIVVLSADRDLMQLAGPDTVWAPWPDDALTAEDIELSWGVRPERLPLLRALAGDASDGIPGITNIGPVKAIGLMDEGKSDLAVIHSLATRLGLEQQARVYAWWVISNLREPVLAPQWTLGEDCVHAEWHPQVHSRSMADFLEQWGMNRLMARQQAGDLPWPPYIPDKEPI